MQPTAAEIERGSRRPRNSPCTTAKPGASLDNQTFHARRVKSPRCGDAGRTATNDHYFVITIYHF
jgi:hypothetical protein